MGLRYQIVGQVGRHPLFFRGWHALRRKYHGLVVSPRTDIVIEGYPRCANSFSVLAFERAQHRPVSIAHHLHAESQLLLGAEFGCPMLVLIREPIGAVASLVTRHPTVSIKEALRRYWYFYKTVQQLNDHLVIADFQQVTSDYAAVVDSLNRRFGTEFERYRNSKEADSEIFNTIDALNRKKFQGALNMVARPEAAREGLLDYWRESVRRHEEVEKCIQLYRQLMKPES